MRGYWTGLMRLTLALLLCAAGAAAGEERAHREEPRTAVRSALPLAGRLELARLLEMAAGRSPIIEAARARWDAAREKRAAVTALPDPKLVYMSWLRQMTPDDEKAMVDLTQEFPLQRKRRLAGRIADRDAEVAYLKYEAAVRDTLGEIKEAYFELYYLDRARVITEEIRKITDRYAALAAGGAERGGGKLPELFRAESQRAQADYDLVQLDTNRHTEAERLRALLDVPDNTEVGPTGDVSEPAVEPPPIDALRALAREHSQELARAGIEVDRAHDAVELARMARVPDFMVGTRYMRTGGQDSPGGDPTQDPFIVMVGLNLPVRGTKNRAAEREAQATERAVRAERSAQDLDLRSRLARAHSGLTNALRMARLYRESLLPQARQALQSAEELHRSGDASLLAVLETTAAVQSFELAAVRATADAYQNIARLERIVGAPISLRPLLVDAAPAITAGRTHATPPAPRPDESLALRLPAGARRRGAELAGDLRSLVSWLRESPSLPVLLAVVARRNPDVKAAAEGLRATRRQLPQATFLEDTLSRYRSLTKDLETGSGRQPRSGMAGAAAAFPSAMTWRGQLAEIRIELSRLRLEQVLRTAVDEAARGHVDVRFAHDALAIMEESRALLAQSGAATRAQLTVAQGGQAESLKSESALATLDAEIAAMRAQERAAMARVNTLLAVPVDVKWGTPADPALADRASPLQALLAMARGESPEIRRAGREVEEAQAMVRMAEAMAFPDAAPQAGPGANAAYIDELRVRVAEQRRMAEATRARVELAVQDAVLRAETARVNLATFDGGVAPRARQVFEAVKARYSNGSATLVELIETARASLDASIKSAEYRRDLRRARIDVADAVGTSATDLVNVAPRR